MPRTVEQAELGAGARWDARRGELLRLDVRAGRVIRDTIDADGALCPVRTYVLPTMVGAIAPIWGDDGWLLAVGRGFVHLTPDGTSRRLVEVTPADARMNDGACDPRGRFWGGSIDGQRRAERGALHRLDSSGHVETVLEGLSIPSGLGWSPDGETMYVIDGGPSVVFSFAYDAAQGTISAGHILLSVPHDAGRPGGLAVDATGDLWVALDGGGSVRRYDREGRLRDEVDVPALQTTSCAFAGRRLDRLYITTGTEGWTAEQRRSDPAAGLVYSVRTGTTGRPADPFIPDRRWWKTVAARAR